MIGSLSPLHWIIIIAVVALLFGGGGKLSGLMGDAAKGIKAFRNGLKEEDGHAPTDTHPAPQPAAPQPAPLPRVEPVVTPEPEKIDR